MSVSRNGSLPIRRGSWARARSGHTAAPRGSPSAEIYLEDIDLKGAWTGPGALDLHAHALAPVAELPVLEILSATHIIADLTLGLGKVIYDYLPKSGEHHAT